MAKRVSPASVEVGYCRRGPARDYANWEASRLQGADIMATDGLGNKIRVYVRAGDIGYRITLNGILVAIGAQRP